MRNLGITNVHSQILHMLEATGGFVMDIFLITSCTISSHGSGNIHSFSLLEPIQSSLAIKYLKYAHSWVREKAGTLTAVTESLLCSLGALAFCCSGGWSWCPARLHLPSLCITTSDCYLAVLSTGGLVSSCLSLLNSLLPGGRVCVTASVLPSSELCGALLSQRRLHFPGWAGHNLWH